MTTGVSVTTPGADTLAAVALSGLPGCGLRRLRLLLDLGPPAETWAAIREGRLAGRAGLSAALGPGAGALLARWRAVATADLDTIAGDLAAAGARVAVLGDPAYPDRLAADPEPPPLVFWRGDRSAVSAPASVAIVGTRRCTGYGVDVARQLGRDLAAAGVAVVSGLALGIDGAAHEGALAGAATSGGGRPIGVVGSGLDVVYPGRHRTLWRRMGEDGLLLSESPLGAAPEPWRFPMRNRLIAALSDVVVVVESHAAGGSMSTVRAADERNVPVMAVPGSVRSSSSTGTNRLLADGIPPVVDAEDVLVALSLQGRFVSGGAPRGGPDPQVEVEGSLDPAASRVLAAVDWTPTSTEDVLRRTQLAVADATVALTRLESAGLVVRRSGGWWERRAAGEPRSR